VQDRLLVGVEDLVHGARVPSLVEVVTDAQGLQPRVAVELLVVVVGDLAEAFLIDGFQDRDGVAPKI
jgi:hypothetical protein